MKQNFRVLKKGGNKSQYKYSNNILKLMYQYRVVNCKNYVYIIIYVIDSMLFSLNSRNAGLGRRIFESWIILETRSPGQIHARRSSR